MQSDLYGLLNALGGARRLRVLDVGGNLAGDAGARLLAKALQCNCTLHTLYIDRNAFSLQGESVDHPFDCIVFAATAVKEQL